MPNRHRRRNSRPARRVQPLRPRAKPHRRSRPARSRPRRQGEIPSSPPLRVPPGLRRCPVRRRPPQNDTSISGGGQITALAPLPHQYEAKHENFHNRGCSRGTPVGQPGCEQCPGAERESFRTECQEWPSDGWSERFERSQDHDRPSPDSRPGPGQSLRCEGWSHRLDKPGPRAAWHSRRKFRRSISPSDQQRPRGAVFTAPSCFAVPACSSKQGGLIGGTHPSMVRSRVSSRARRAGCAARLGRSQVVRQRILIPPSPGSNPGAPASHRGLLRVTSRAVQRADISEG